MSTTIPTTEPTAACAGDTWRWSRSLSDYPASTWTLTYTLINASGKVTVAATVDGDTHAVSVPPATTAAYSAGRYDWVAHVSDGTDRYQVGAGSINVLPDLSAASTYDGRSHARKMLDAINAMLEGRATSAQLDLVSTDFDGRKMDRRPDELIKMRDRYAAAVAQEEQAAALARGEKIGRMIQVRFR
jgi:hypothetical protein